MENIENRNQKLWDLFKARSLYSQKEFGRRFDIGSVSNVSQYLHGFRPLNLRAALKFARGLQVSLDEVSPDLANLAREAAEAVNQAPAQASSVGKPVNVYSCSQALVASQGSVATTSGTIRTDYESNLTLMGIRVETDDMSPIYKRGDVVVVDRARTPGPGDVVLAAIGKRTVAVLREYTVLGINENGEDIVELTPLDKRFPVFNTGTVAVRILGVAIEHRRFL